MGVHGEVEGDTRVRAVGMSHGSGERLLAAGDEFQLFECVLPENVYAAVIVAWLNQRNGSVRRHRIESQRARVLHMHKA